MIALLFKHSLFFFIFHFFIVILHFFIFLLHLILLFWNKIFHFPTFFEFLNFTKEILVKSEKDNIKIQSEFFLISVGANAIKPQGLSLNKKDIITSDEIFNLKVIPKSLSIIGCGVIGIEYASMFAKLGVEVTIIDGRDRPLEFLDSEILDELIIQIKKMGVVFKLNENVKDIEIIKDKQRAVLIHLKSGKKVLSELAILCAGRKGSTENLNL